MTRVAIKTCGLNSAEAIDAALRGGARHIGFVHFPRVPAEAQRVAVLVDPDDALVDALIAAGGLQVLQLHGNEPPSRVAQLRARTGLAVWKAVSVRTAADLVVGNAYAGAADLLLYDAKTPEGAALPGGMGHRFDWTLLAGHRPPLPWGLSGGLDADNVAQAIAITRAPLVDVSSGIERAPGVKDVDKIAAFCKAVGAC